jgi:DNA repair protein RecO (recombination protein O)
LKISAVWRGIMIICKGLVIRENIQGESNKIINIFTKKYGVICATAQGARKPNGKNTSGCQLFSYAEFSIEKTKGWYYVKSVQPVHIFYSLRNSLEKISLASYFMQIIYECIMENQNSGDTLRLILNTLHYLENDKRSPMLLKSIFELRFLCEIGLMPDLLACHMCGEYLPENPVFLISKGIFYCDDCLKKEPPVNYNQDDIFPVSKSLLHVIRFIALSDFEKIFSFKISKESEERLNLFCERYMYSQLQRDFSALKFYKSIHKGEM